jgi:hypothetical protein
MTCHNTYLVDCGGNKSHEYQEISILMIKKARTRQKKHSLKSKKDFQIRTEEPGRRKQRRVQVELEQ